MYHIYGKIRDYNGTTDLASVELEGLGQIDNWIDGLAIDQAINRGFLTHGAPVTLTVPDEWRLPEAVVVAIGTDPSKAIQQNAAGVYTHQHGRGVIPTDNTGTGLLAQSYSPSFATLPYLAVNSDDGVAITITGTAISSFTVKTTVGPINGYVPISWHAQGN